MVTSTEIATEGVCGDDEDTAAHAVSSCVPPAGPHHRPRDLTAAQREVFRQTANRSRLAKMRAVNGAGPAPIHEINVPRLRPEVLMPQQPRNGIRALSPGDLRVIGHRDPRSRPAESDDPWSALGTLAAIARRLDVRDIDGRRERVPLDVAPLCAWLCARLDALCAAGWVSDAWHDLRVLHGQLRAASGDPAPRPLGPCRQLVDDDGRLDPKGEQRCGTALYLPEQAPKGMDEPVVLPTVRCRACGWTYTGVELVRLARERERSCA